MAKELLKFQATWCGPCKMLSKVMEGEDLNVPVREIDIDAERDTAVKYGIRGVPTLILVDENGVEIKRQSGVMMINELRTWLEA